MDALFSSDWRARETALNDISREAISLLLSSSVGGDHAPSSIAAEASVVISGRETSPRVGCSQVQEVCMEVVKLSCGDSVLKVFLAALVRYPGGNGQETRGERALKVEFYWGGRISLGEAEFHWGAEFYWGKSLVRRTYMVKRLEWPAL